MIRRQFLQLSMPALALRAAALPRGVRLIEGPVNRVEVGSRTAVYSAPANATQVLLTHARRDSIGSLPSGADVLVPADSLSLFTQPEAFWQTMRTAQFHDYAQQSSRVPTRALPKVRPVREGETIPAEDATIRVIATPGYSPGAVSYVIEAGGQRLVATGDLIYGDGQLRDLFSLQDAVPEVKLRGYHGYAARAEALIASLRAVAALKPDALLPAHGPLIANPSAAIDRLIGRLQAFLQSHFETDALLWYFGEDSHRKRSRAVERPLNVMPMAEQASLPADILAFGNSRLILSRSGAGFLVDAGFRGTLPELRRLKESGRLRSVDGVWVTHYHDDHTDYLNDVTAEFGSPIYYTQAMAEVMANPAGFRLPCLTTKPVAKPLPQADGANLRWQEWQFTFWNFPGQTLYHGGLVARRDDGQTYLFVGDSFTPSGMDDYCMQNRDLLRPGAGYDLCLTRIQSLPSNTWLMNQHVAPMFRYTPAQIERMRDELAKRTGILRTLAPFPDPNYAVDEDWARLYPYASQAKAGESIELEFRITNHAPVRTSYRVDWHWPAGASPPQSGTVAIAPFAEGVVRGRFTAPRPGFYVVTASVTFGGHRLPEWAEAMVEVR